MDKIPVTKAKVRIRIGDGYRIEILDEEKHETALIYNKGKICLTANVWKNDFGYPGKGKKRIKVTPENYGLGSTTGFFDKDIIKFEVNGKTQKGKVHFLIENVVEDKDPWQVISENGETFKLKDVKPICYIGTEMDGENLYVRKQVASEHTSSSPDEAQENEPVLKSDDNGQIKMDCIKEPKEVYEEVSEEAPAIDAKDHYVIYTDGSSLSNPGPCGGAYVMMLGGVPIGEREIPIGDGTNNIAELTAVIEALNDVKSFNPGKVTIITDSKYVIDGVTSWSHNWRKNGWKNSAGEDVQNMELWKKLLAENAIVNADFQWVKGHSGDLVNEKVDSLAKAAAKRSIQVS